MRDNTIKNYIFDLGGVILDLSVISTLKSFAKLAGKSVDEVKAIYLGAPAFEDYEKGLITDHQFRESVRSGFNVSASDEEINRCWNAMLKGVTQPRVDLLLKLKETHKVVLLSNTNQIHLDEINNVILPRDLNVNSLDGFFHRTYYSHYMKLRKPEVAIYEQVLNENKFVAEETLFLDDNVFNLEGAATLGIKTFQVQSPDHMLSYFNG